MQYDLFAYEVLKRDERESITPNESESLVIAVWMNKVEKQSLQNIFTILLIILIYTLLLGTISKSKNWHFCSACLPLLTCVVTPCPQLELIAKTFDVCLCAWNKVFAVVVFLKSQFKRQKNLARKTWMKTFGLLKSHMDVYLRATKTRTTEKELFFEILCAVKEICAKLKRLKFTSNWHAVRVWICDKNFHLFSKQCVFPIRLSVSIRSGCVNIPRLHYKLNSKQCISKPYGSWLLVEQKPKRIFGNVDNERSLFVEKECRLMVNMWT